MIVTMLVLAAVLLAILGLIVSLVPPHLVGVDEGGIHTAEELDAAVAIQRSMRITELRRRIANRDYWSYALFGLALLMQMIAFAVDHFVHPSIGRLLSVFHTARPVGGTGCDRGERTGLAPAG